MQWISNLLSPDNGALKIVVIAAVVVAIALILVVVYRWRSAVGCAFPEAAARASRIWGWSTPFLWTDSANWSWCAATTSNISS